MNLYGLYGFKKKVFRYSLFAIRYSLNHLMLRFPLQS